MSLERHGIERGLAVLRAEEELDLTRYEGMHQDAVPLVATIEKIIPELHSDAPSVMEIGPVPTLAYSMKGRHAEEFDPKKAASLLTGRDHVREVSPLALLAERHGDWRLAAASPHDIPAALKSALMKGRTDLYMVELGPERAHGIRPDDVFDERYVHGDPDALAKLYPALFEKLGGAPDIVFGRHVFDSVADTYQVGKLTTMAAMLLKPGGYLVSMVYGSDAYHSHVPLHGQYHFPFDDASMQHVAVIDFPGSRKDPSDRLFVHVYRKAGDPIRRAYLRRR